MLAHWDDVTATVIDLGDLQGRRTRLGAAAGCVRLGVSRYVLAPGTRAMPVHSHVDEEELFFVLAGSALSVEGDASHPVRAGDVICYPAGGPPHTIVAGDDGLDVLALASGSATGLTWLPRPNAMWVGGRWLPLDGEHPFAAEAAAGALVPPPPAAVRPATISALADAPRHERRVGDISQEWHDLGTAVGSTVTGLRHIAVDAGARSNPPHCHSVEEEAFVILDGAGSLELIDAGGAVTSHDVRAGHVVARPSGTGVAHSFLAGDDGLTVLAFGHRDPADVRFYPRSGKIAIPGVKAVFRIQRVDLLDGEA